MRSQFNNRLALGQTDTLTMLHIAVTSRHLLFGIDRRKHESTTAAQKEGNNHGRISHAIHHFVQRLTVRPISPQTKSPHNGPRKNEQIAQTQNHVRTALALAVRHAGRHTGNDQIGNARAQNIFQEGWPAVKATVDGIVPSLVDNFDNGNGQCGGADGKEDKSGGHATEGAFVGHEDWHG